MKKKCLLFPCLLSITALPAQTIGTFTSVQPTAQTQTLVIPSTHRMQRLAQTGDVLPNGSQLMTSPDFTGFVPIGGSSTDGYLSLNHEITGNGGVTVFDAHLNAATKLWGLSNGVPINFSSVVKTERNCSGGITPWGNVISSEEATSTADANANGYHDIGWLVEINPATRQVVRKVYGAGKSSKENAAILPDQKTIYTGCDNATYGYVYKFVANTPGDLSVGTLYVLRRSATNPTRGTWVVLPNNTATRCNNAQVNAFNKSATNFNGVEDMEIGPDGKVYFATKASGQIWRFKDNGTTVSNLGVFVESTSYPINYGTGTASTAWGIGNDNLAFDGEGNLWVLQDGSNNHIWMVRPTHTAANPAIELFATTPAGCEPTGITFSPDYKYMFLSMQHPSGTNTLALTDAAGQSVVFNKGTTLVISRAEWLGTTMEQNVVEDREKPVLSAFAIQIAPNPVLAGQAFQIQMDNGEADARVSLSISDLAGKVVYSNNIVTGKQRNVTIPGLAAGVYVVQAKSASGMTCIRKVIVQSK